MCHLYGWLKEILKNAKGGLFLSSLLLVPIAKHGHFESLSAWLYGLYVESIFSHSLAVSSVFLALVVTFSIAEALFFYRNIKIKRVEKIMFWLAVLAVVIFYQGISTVKLHTRKDKNQGLWIKLKHPRFRFLNVYQSKE